MLFRTCFVLVAISFCLTSPSYALTLNTDVQKSPNDQREYAYITLSNKLDVLLISDASADKGAASLDIRVGSSDDPEDFPGLAHFLEHMLFLGTAKYPEPDAYQKFISEHGGGHNAYTTLEHTNYFFDVSAPHLEEALDRFSQQFTAPLFNKDYVQREVNAVHSEYSSKIQDDGRRYLESFKDILNPKHPYGNFAVGNLQTLVDNEQSSLRDALLSFYDNEYSANRMKLTVLGKEDLETLAKWVESKFSKIANKNLPKNYIDTPFFSGGFLPAQINVENIMDTRTMSLSFPVPSTRPYIHEQPAGYLANLIGHEGRGSLLSLLKKKELADTLSAGTQFDTGNEALFIISMSLTPTGMKQQDEVIKSVFSYIALLKTEGIKKLYFDEQAKLDQINFKFKEKAPALGYVRALSATLHELPAKDILAAPYQLNKYDQPLIERYLERLNPNNLLVSIRAKDVPTDQETQWFKTPYSTNSLSISLSNALRKIKANDELSLPAPNTFIPDNTELSQQVNNKIPEKISAEEGVELWHATDTEFGTPKSTFYLSVRSPHAIDSVEHLVMTQLLVSMLVDNLVEFSYPAHLAGLSYDLYKHLRGVTLKIAGYNDKQDELLDTVLSKINHSDLREERFSNIKERLTRSLENEKERKPFQQAVSELQDTLLVPSWSAEQKLSALREIDVSQLRAFKELFFSTVDLAVLSNGNVEKSQTKKLAALASKHLLAGAEVKKVDRARVLDLSGETDWAKSLDVEHPDTSLIYYMQGGSKDYTERALYSVLSQAVGNDYYALLRTDKQLGYIVFATPFPMLEVPGIAFAVQSPNTSTDTIYKETRSFISDQSSRIAALAIEDFDRYKQAVISRLEEKETNIGQRSNRYWSEIDKQNYGFDSKLQLISAVENLKLEEFKSFYMERIKTKGNNITIVSGHKENPSTNEEDQKEGEGDSPDNNSELSSDLRDALNKSQGAWDTLTTF